MLPKKDNHQPQLSPPGYCRFNPSHFRHILFFIAIAFFKVSLCMLPKVLISALVFAYNMLCEIEYVVTVLRYKVSLD